MGDGDSLLGRIRSRYVLRLGLVAGAILVIMLVLGANSLVQITDAVTADSQRGLERTSELQGTAVDRWATDTERQTRLIADDEVFGDGGSDGGPPQGAVEEHLLANAGREGPFGGEVVGIHYLAARDGTAAVVASTGDLADVPAGLDGAAEATESTVVGPYDSPLTDAPALAFVAPVDGGGVVAVVVDTDRAARSLLDAPREGQSFVLDGEGRILVSTDRRYVGQSAGNGSVATPGMVGATGSRYVGTVSTNGTDRATAVAGVEDRDWTVATQQSTGVAFELADTVRLLVVLLLGGLVMSFVLFLAAISQETVADIRDLSAKAEQIAAEGADAEVSLETDRPDEIGTLYESIDEMQSSLEGQITGLEELNDRMNAVVADHGAVLDACADGDLSRRMDTDTGVDQLDDLAAEFNETMAAIEDGVRGAVEFANTVGTASYRAAEAVEETEEISREVTETSREIRAGAREQSDQLDDTVDRMRSFSASIDEVASAAEDLSARSTAAAATADDGRAAASEAADRLEAIERETEAVVESFADLEEEVETVGEIADSIGELADQTNVLAMNANIEASRSGSGDSEGFGVVADEFKNFAEQTNQSAEDIERRLDAIRRRTRQTGEDVEEARAAIEEGIETTERALQALEEVAAEVREIDDDADRIDGLTDRQSEDARAVLDRVQEVADIAEDSADSSEAVVAAARRQTDAVGTVRETVAELYDRAERLNDLLDRFEVDRED